MLLSPRFRSRVPLVCLPLALIACFSPAPLPKITPPVLVSNHHVPAGPSARQAPPLGALVPIRPNSLSAFAGSAIDWEYVYNRNALVGSEVVGPYIVAITEAGHLLVFDAATMHLVAEALAPDPVKCIGAPNAHDVLIGFSNGRIARVSIPDFTVEELESVAGEPLWLGRVSSSGAIVPDDFGLGAKEYFS